MRTKRLLHVVLALLLCGAGTAAAQKSRKPATHTVTVDATSFTPATVTVKAGDSVVWVNKDMMPHTATSKQAGLFDSNTLAPGKSWKQTFKKKGDFPYICQFHPTMKGTVVVK